MASTKLNLNAEEILAFAQLAGITLTPNGVIFPNICARSTVVYSAVGLVDYEDPEYGHTQYVPIYEKEYEDQTGFSQNQLQAFEYGFEQCNDLAQRHCMQKMVEFAEGAKLRKLVRGKPSV